MSLVAQTLDRVSVHLIFSTKERANLIPPEVESELHAYLAGIANNLDSRCLAVNGTADHVHMLVSQSKSVGLAELVAEVKKGSSKWIKTKSALLGNFHWQDGYAAFSVSESNAASVQQYIADQKEHHRKRSFQEELIRFLRKHGVEEERYIWTQTGIINADEEVRVRLDSGRWVMERGDFHAEWDPERRQGWVRQTANPNAIDGVLRILHSLILALEGGFLVHAASAVRNGRAFVFAGVSGAGKTTISGLAPPDVVLLTDEISYVREVRSQE